MLPTWFHIVFEEASRYISLSLLQNFLAAPYRPQTHCYYLGMLIQNQFATDGGLMLQLLHKLTEPTLVLQ